MNAITAGNLIVPLEAVQPRDKQVLAAAEPRTNPGAPPLSLDALAAIPNVESVVTSTEIRLATRLGSVWSSLQCSMMPVLTPAANESAKNAQSNATGVATRTATAKVSPGLSMSVLTSVPSAPHTV